MRSMYIPLAQAQTDLQFSSIQTLTTECSKSWETCQESGWAWVSCLDSVTTVTKAGPIKRFWITSFYLKDQRFHWLNGTFSVWSTTSWQEVVTNNSIFAEFPVCSRLFESLTNYAWNSSWVTPGQIFNAKFIDWQIHNEPWEMFELTCSKLKT